MDLDEYATQWLVGERLREKPARAAAYALLAADRIPVRRRARVIVGRALIRAGERVAGQIPAGTGAVARSQESTRG